VVAENSQHVTPRRCATHPRCDLQEYKGTLKIVKVETDPNPKLVEQFGVYGLPSVLLFKDGVPLENSKREGALSKAKLIQHISDCGIPLPAAA